MRLFAASAHGRFWHFSAVPTAPANVRSWVENGLNADVALGQFMTLNGLSSLSIDALREAHRAHAPLMSRRAVVIR